MDSEDEAIPYLKLLRENSGNYLLQNSYELQDCLSAESIFTEIERGTSSPECFPVSNLSDRIRNTPKDPVFRFHSINVQSEESQQGKHKKTLLLLANGNTYELSVSNESTDSIEFQDIHKKSNIPQDSSLFSTEDKGDIFQVRSSHKMEDREKKISLSEKSAVGSNKDLSDWKEFYTTVCAMKCKVCSFLCESSVGMMNHFNRQHSELLHLKRIAEQNSGNGKPKVKMKSLLDNPVNKVTMFLCSMCNKVFSNEDLLVEHMKIHNQVSDSSGAKKKVEVSREKTVQEEQPKHKFANLATEIMKKHQAAVKKLKCSRKGCALKFSNYESRELHEACHSLDMKKLHCPECLKEFTIWRACNKHIWTCHKKDAGLIYCPLCPTFKSYSSAAVVNHMINHNKEKPFVCKECFKGFKKPNQLREHRLSHKCDELQPLLEKRCSICERLFANTRTLRDHIEIVHEKIKPLRCDVCGHRTAKKAMLELHMRQHTGDKPYECSRCPYKTRDPSCLRNHKKTHDGVPTYSCPYCEYKAIQNTAYKRHLRAKHPNAKELFRCTYCPFTSLRSTNYLTHIKCHEYDAAQGTATRSQDEAPSHSFLPDDPDNPDEIEDKGSTTISSKSRMKPTK